MNKTLEQESIDQTKQLIRLRFKNQLKTYPANAVIQKQMAGQLLERVLKKSSPVFEQIFEIGCGSGFLTQYLVEKTSFRTLFANDIVPEAAEFVTPLARGIQFLAGDVENLAPFPGQLDLIISNASFQWLSDFDLLIKRLFNSLKKGGLLAFTTFGPDQFRELCQLGYPGLSYLEPDTIKQKFRQQWQALDFEEMRTKLYFTGSFSALKHINQTGVSLSRQTWTKGRLNNLMIEYNQKHMTARGVPLTYHALYFIFRKL